MIHKLELYTLGICFAQRLIRVLLYPSAQIISTNTETRNIFAGNRFVQTKPPTIQYDAAIWKPPRHDMAVTSESSTTDLHIYAAYMGKTDTRVTMVAQVKLKEKIFQTHFTISSKILIIIIIIIIICYYLYTKRKATLVQAWTGVEGTRNLRLPDFMTIGCQP